MENSNRKESVGPSIDGPTNFHEAASNLAKLARKAFEEKHLPDCLTLTAAILNMDPENKEAHVLRSWVQADLDHEFQLAVTMANEARRQNNRRTWSGVQTTLRKVLGVYPDHEGAQALLAEALSAVQVLERSPDFEERKPLLEERRPLFEERRPVEERNTFDRREPPQAELAPFHPVPFEPLPFDPVPARNRPAWMVPAGVGVLLLLLASFGYVAFIRFQQPATDSTRSAGDGNQGTLSIQVDDGLQVFVDGEYRGIAPLPPMTLPVGKHQVSYKANDVLIAQEDIEVPSNSTATNTSEKLVGRVDLVVVPSTGVILTVDGAKIGPPPSFILLKSGPHELMFTAVGRTPEVRSLIVSAGEQRIIPILLKESNASNIGAPKSGQSALPKQADAIAPPPAPRANPADRGEPIAPVAVPNETARPSDVRPPASIGLSAAARPDGLPDPGNTLKLVEPDKAPPAAVSPPAPVASGRPSTAPVTPAAVTPAPVASPVTPPPAAPAATAPAASSATPARIRQSPVVSRGNQIYSPPPEYPTLAKAGRIEGAVVFDAVISKAGLVQSLTLVSGNKLFVPAAQDAVKTWRYKPTLLDSEPVEVMTTITVNFTVK